MIGRENVRWLRIPCRTSGVLILLFPAYQRGRARIPSSESGIPSTPERLRHFGMRKARKTHRNAELSPKLGREGDILVSELEREIGRIERALKKLPAEPVERALASERALAYRRPQREWIDTGFDAERENFGEGRLDDITRAVMDELRDRPRADVADVDHLVADRVEHGFVPIEDRLVAADQQRELA